MDARTSHKQKRVSKNQEEQVARELGGRTQPASGGTRTGGGSDVRSETEAVECKYTDKKQYTLKQNDLLKIRRTAIQHGLLSPVLQLNFPNHLNPGAPADRYAIIPWHDYLALLEGQKTS